MQQARASEAIANQNAALQRQNAAQQSEAMRAQAHLQELQTRQNFALRSADATAKQQQANTMRQQASAQEAVNARNLTLRRQEGERLMAAQRARMAAAGVVESTGSPLSMLAETAGLIQRDIGEQQYRNELATQGLLQQASMERLGGEYALAGATFDRGAGMAEANLRNAAASASLFSGNREADITRMAGQAQASGYRYGALASGIGGLGQAFDTYGKYKGWGLLS